VAAFADPQASKTTGDKLRGLLADASIRTTPELTELWVGSVSPHPPDPYLLTQLLTRAGSLDRCDASLLHVSTV